MIERLSVSTVTRLGSSFQLPQVTSVTNRNGIDSIAKQTLQWTRYTGLRQHLQVHIGTASGRVYRIEVASPRLKYKAVLLILGGLRCCTLWICAWWKV